MTDPKPPVPSEHELNRIFYEGARRNPPDSGDYQRSQDGWAELWLAGYHARDAREERLEGDNRFVQSELMKRIAELEAEVAELRAYKSQRDAGDRASAELSAKLSELAGSGEVSEYVYLPEDARTIKRIVSFTGQEEVSRDGGVTWKPMPLLLEAAVRLEDQADGLHARLDEHAAILRDLRAKIDTAPRRTPELTERVTAKLIELMHLGPPSETRARIFAAEIDDLVFGKDPTDG